MRRIWAALLVAALLFGGCGKNDASAPAESAGAETTAAATVPPDGNPKDVTCLGSYTREGSASAVIATAGDESLTNAQLAVWYWAQVAQYRASGDAPDSAEPLDQQPCGVDDSVNSWQQYFLKRALNAWHRASRR